MLTLPGEVANVRAELVKGADSTPVRVNETGTAAIGGRTFVVACKVDASGNDVLPIPGDVVVVVVIVGSEVCETPGSEAVFGDRETLARGGPD